MEDDWRDEKDARQILFPRKAVALETQIRLEKITHTKKHVIYIFSTLGVTTAILLELSISIFLELAFSGIDFCDKLFLYPTIFLKDRFLYLRYSLLFFLLLSSLDVALPR